MMTESVEQFMEVARQIENEEAVLGHTRDEREGSRESDRDDDRERIRKGGSFERERKDSRYSPYPSSKTDRDRARKTNSRKENRVYVSNLPFSLKWQELKDHMKKVGDVVFAEILEDTSGKSKGCGIVEFSSSGDATKAIRELNDTDLGGRMLKIREDRVESDDRPRRPRERSSNNSNSPANLLGGLGGLAGMMGLGQFGLLQQMSTRSDPSSCSVFVSNLDYRVNWAKLKDTFKAAGRVVRADISENDDGKSKGHGTVQFETPVEAVNAVGVMNGKSLFDRTMNVRLDRESPYFAMFGGNTGGASMTPNLANMAGMAGIAGMAGMNPFAMLQLQSMASLGSMAGLGGLAGFGGMNYGGAGTVQGTQTSGMTTGVSDTASALTSAGISAAMSSANPYASMFSGQGLTGQNMMMMPMTQSHSKVDTSKQVFVRNESYGVCGWEVEGLVGLSMDIKDHYSWYPYAVLTIKGLPWKVTWQELKDKFREAGRVVRADVLMDDQQRSKGCATVLFESSEEAARAISTLNGTIMDGREIEVRVDRG